MHQLKLTKQLSTYMYIGTLMIAQHKNVLSMILILRISVINVIRLVTIYDAFVFATTPCYLLKKKQGIIESDRLRKIDSHC